MRATIVQADSSGGHLGGAMNRVQLAVVALVAFGTNAWAGTPSVPAPAAHQASDEAAVLATMDRYLAAISADDLAGMAALQTPDGMTYRARALLVADGAGPRQHRGGVGAIRVLGRRQDQSLRRRRIRLRQGGRHLARGECDVDSGTGRLRRTPTEGRHRNSAEGLKAGASAIVHIGRARGLTGVHCPGNVTAGAVPRAAVPLLLVEPVRRRA